MKSVEFSSVRGVSAVVVSLRAMHLLSAAKQDFIWYLQWLSLRDGGFRRLARELVKMFPERLGTPEMHKANLVSGKTYHEDVVCAAEIALGIRSAYEFLDWDSLLSDRPYSDGITDKAVGQTTCSSRDRQSLKDLCRQAALGQLQPGSRFKQLESDVQRGKSFERLPIENLLVELCTNPKLNFDLPGIDGFVEEYETERAMEADPELVRDDFKIARLIYFQDIIGALVEYRARHLKRVKSSFCLTAIGEKVWETLDFALKGKCMVLVNGLPGRGKSEAAKAMCELNSGRARYVSLKGVATKTGMFRAICTALGITYAYGRTAPEMQARIEDVLSRSKIMLVIDEAHFAFNQGQQMTARPELIDWIDTALCNDDTNHRGSVPVALITTPQFLDRLARAKNQVGWNYEQFRRRAGRWVTLPPQNSEADIFAVARSVFPKACEASIKEIVSYALLCHRDLSAVGDVAREVRVMMGTEDLTGATLAQIRHAIDDFLIPSDLAFTVGLASAEAKLPRGKRNEPKPAEAQGEYEASEEAAAPAAEPAPEPAAAPVDESPAIPAADRVRGQRRRAAVIPSAVAAPVVPPRGGDTEAVLTAN